MRTIIDVPEELLRSLDQVVARESRSRAAVVRDAITRYVDEQKRAASGEAFGVWKEQPKDGVAYQEDLRGEWER